MAGLFRNTHREKIVADFSNIKAAFDEEAAVNKKQLELMRFCVAKGMKNALSEKQLGAVEMYFFKGMGMGEIAKTLGINKSSVSRRITGAKRRLKNLTEMLMDAYGSIEGE